MIRQRWLNFKMGVLAVLAVLAQSCSPVPDPALTPAPTSPPPTFGTVIFCQSVSPAGQPLNPAAQFPAGTRTVWAYFRYANLLPGAAWGRVWEKDGLPYADMNGETWNQGPSGWTAYSITAPGPDVPLQGSFTLKLYLNGQVVQQATFSVPGPEAATAAPPSEGLGAIHFAADLTPDLVPVGETSLFRAGVPVVYALFSYSNLPPGARIRLDWLRDGAVYASEERRAAGSGLAQDSAHLSAPRGLEPGSYTLRLSINSQPSAVAPSGVPGSAVERKASFRVLSPADWPSAGPSQPTGLIDARMLPAWTNLLNARAPLLRSLAQFVLDEHIHIRVDEHNDGPAAYRHSCAVPPVAGEVVVSADYLYSHSPAEVTGALAHELTHAIQHLSGAYPCGCSIEKEYYAYITEFYALQELNRTDILEQDYRAAYDASGRFDPQALWSALLKNYPNCQAR